MSNRGYEKLERNLIDIVKEQQAKLGYRKEIVRLYYPLKSLNHFFEGSYRVKEMLSILNDAPDSLTGRLGKIRATANGSQICIEIPESGSEYVHKNTAENEFINELISVVGRHGCSIDEVIGLFRAHSDEIEIKEIDNGEFDCYIRFLNDENDTYYYCFHDEGCHMIYHRFMPEDYNDFGF